MAKASDNIPSQDNYSISAPQPTEKEVLLKYLDDVIVSEAPRLIGKLMKRFEIIDNVDYLKKEVKELVYEEFRNMRDIFYAYANGIEITKFNFIDRK